MTKVETLERVHDHFHESLNYFKPNNIVFLGLQGSQNYGLETPFSDVDTKLIVTPSLHDIIMNKQAVSTTHVRENNEHTDFKDIRLMFGTFRKQNLNFLEILFTDYFVLNPEYINEWNELIDHREEVAHYNIYSAVKAMKGVALEKYHAMEHRYPAKIEVIDKFGYDPKQLHHLLRVEDYLARYINGENYQSCLKPSANLREYLVWIKLGGLDLKDARETADASMQAIEKICEPFTKESKYNKDNPFIDELLDKVQESIMTKSITNELKMENKI